ncbi:MAG: DoxX family protein [Candidatus Thermoplasmatota archaeon]|nr:DoxX family protein [Candidatus Thermoplasmatota archaeon]
MGTSRSSTTSFALLPLRLGLASVFIVYGWSKLTGMSGWEAMLDGWGIPAAAFFAPLVAIAEFFGGIGLLLGVLTRFSSAVLSVVIATAIVTVKFGSGFQGGWAFDLALLAGLVTLVVNGPGRPTIFSAIDRPDLDPEARLTGRLRGDDAPPRA